jgi:hypothetical protein
MSSSGKTHRRVFRTECSLRGTLLGRCFDILRATSLDRLSPRVIPAGVKLSSNAFRMLLFRRNLGGGGGALFFAPRAADGRANYLQIEPSTMIRFLASVFRGVHFILGITAPPPGHDERRFVLIWLAAVVRYCCSSAGCSISSRISTFTINRCAHAPLIIPGGQNQSER